MIAGRGLSVFAICTALAGTPLMAQQTDCVAISETVQACGLDRAWFAAPAGPEPGTPVIFSNALTNGISQTTTGPFTAEDVTDIYGTNPDPLSGFALDEADITSLYPSVTFTMTSTVGTRISPAIFTWIGTQPDAVVIETIYSNLFQLPDHTQLSAEQRAAHAALVAAITENTP